MPDVVTRVERVISDLGVVPVTNEQLVGLVQTLALQLFYVVADNQQLHAEIAAAKAELAAEVAKLTEAMSGPFLGVGEDTVLTQA